MISANGGLPAHRYTPQVTPRWPRGSEPTSEPMVHPLVLLTVGCFLHDLGFLLPYCNTQPTLALTVVLTTALPVQLDFTSSPRVISQLNQPAQEAASCHGFHVPQTKLNCITPRPKLNLRSSQTTTTHTTQVHHTPFPKKITGTASLFPPLPKHRRPLRTRATQTLFAAATILPLLACKNMVQLTKDRGKKQRHSNLCV